MSTSDCAKALQAISSLGLLPKRPDLGRVVCTSRAEKEAPPARPSRPDTTGQVTSEHTASNGRTVRENEVLGVPVEWPRNVTVHVPTVNDRWYTYTAKKG
ncbi:hypothetical protein FXF65_31925 [Actinomadura syzygii]|uniref:Uncharacterized protein n=1 Tax=Actinomadura syzygii TaxID=1427538 RepID=A0A5D0TXC8_9ACTN|nr:hypothetical protein FXF65_31925 [Actinomadura syzygii]